MKILLVTASFYPQISPRSFRMTELCKQFCRDQHEVTVVTPVTEECSKMAEQLGFRLLNLKRPFSSVKRGGSNKFTSEIRRWLSLGLQVFLEYKGTATFTTTAGLQ